MRTAALFALAAFALAAPAGAQTLDRLRETGEIRLGYRLDALPLSYADDGGLPSGYTVEVCKAVAEALKTRLELPALATKFVPVTTEDQFDAITGGKIDLLCGAATVTLTRRETIDFSIPTYVDGAAALLPKGVGAGMVTLAGKRVGVHAGTTTEAALRKSLADEKVDAEVVLFDDHKAGRAALEAGDIAAYFGDQSILIGLILTSGDREALTLSNEMLTVEKQALGLPRGDTDFRLEVDRALSELYISGRMQEMVIAALPGLEPGLALRALFLIAPDLE